MLTWFVHAGVRSELERGHAVRLKCGASLRVGQRNDVAEHLVDRFRVPLASARRRRRGQSFELADQNLELLVTRPIHERKPTAKIPGFACGGSAQRLVLLE